MKLDNCRFSFLPGSLLLLCIVMLVASHQSPGHLLSHAQTHTLVS